MKATVHTKTNDLQKMALEKSVLLQIDWRCGLLRYSIHYWQSCSVLYCSPIRLRRKVPPKTRVEQRLLCDFLNSVVIARGKAK